MADYRLNFLNWSGRVRHEVVISCEDDEEAVAMVERHRDGQAVEVWQGERLVRRFAPGDGS